jgi:hypothetical protein
MNLLKISADVLSMKSNISKIGHILKELCSHINNQNSYQYYKQNQTLDSVYACLCVSTVDYYKQNRIKFFSPILHSPSVNWKSLPYAFPISPMGGFDDSGLTWVPPAGSTVLITFEAGSRRTPYYIGTTWSRTRYETSDKNSTSPFNFPVPEYDEIYNGKRDGYLLGPQNSQVLPPWNTENYNGYDIDTLLEVALNPNAQKRITYPNIYGFKTPDKHMLKMVDGDPKCNRRWKRMELLSGNGNWMIFKDDLFHYAGQWTHPDCKSGTKGDTSCVNNVPNPTSSFSELVGQVLAGSPIAALEIAITGNLLNTPILPFEKTQVPENEIYPNQDFQQFQQFCDSSESSNPYGGYILPAKDANQKDSKKNSYVPGNQTTGESHKIGTNPFFKNANECRPYKGPGTPQNNRADLPQTGIQLLSISGHTFVMDDSVEFPQGTTDWHRSLESFDYGCTDTFMGRSYIKSSTGHLIELNDLEKISRTRGEKNGILLKSALGNKIHLCDDTKNEDGLANENTGIYMESTSKHTFFMCDNGNINVKEKRKENNNNATLATDAYIRMRTGYGLEFMMLDINSQQATQSQAIQILSPQYDNQEKGPHFMQFLESPQGPGQILLRAGGNYIEFTVDDSYEVVGYKPDPNDKEKAIPTGGKKVTFSSGPNYSITEQDSHVRISEQFDYNWAKKQSYVLAGEDYPILDDEGNDTGKKGPGVFPVVVFVPTVDPKTKKVNGGYLRISDRVFSSVSSKGGFVTKRNLLGG